MDLCRDWIGPDARRRAARHRARRRPSSLDGRRHLRGSRPAGRSTRTATATSWPPRRVLFDVTGPDGDRLLYATDTGPLPPTRRSTRLDGPFDVVLLDETFGDTTDHGTGHLDLATLPAVAGRPPRVRGGHADHGRRRHAPEPPQPADARCCAVGSPPSASRLLDDLDVIDTAMPGGGLARRAPRPRRGALGQVGATPSGSPPSAAGTSPTSRRRGSDPTTPSGQHRVAAHRERRPAALDHPRDDRRRRRPRRRPGAARSCSSTASPCGSPRSSTTSTRGARTRPGTRTRCRRTRPRGSSTLVAALADVHAPTSSSCPTRSGMGVVPATASGRLFRDLLGILNMQVAPPATRRPSSSPGIADPARAAREDRHARMPADQRPATRRGRRSGRAARQARLTKPAGALGRLEAASIWMSAVQGQCPPSPFRRPALVIFAGDHGVARTAGHVGLPARGHRPDGGQLRDGRRGGQRARPPDGCDRARRRRQRRRRPVLPGRHRPGRSAPGASVARSGIDRPRGRHDRRRGVRTPSRSAARSPTRRPTPGRTSSSPATWASATRRRRPR